MNIWIGTYILKLSFILMNISKNFKQTNSKMYEQTANSFNLIRIQYKASKLVKLNS